MIRNFEITAGEVKDVIPNCPQMIHYYSTPVKLFHNFVIYIILNFTSNGFARLCFLFIYFAYMHYSVGVDLTCFIYSRLKTCVLIASIQFDK